jgi:hypothetical protein
LKQIATNTGEKDQTTGVLAKAIVGHAEVDYGSFEPFERKVLVIR